MRFCFALGWPISVHRSAFDEQEAHYEQRLTYLRNLKTAFASIREVAALAPDLAPKIAAEAMVLADEFGYRLPVPERERERDGVLPAFKDLDRATETNKQKVDRYFAQRENEPATVDVIATATGIPQASIRYLFSSSHKHEYETAPVPGAKLKHWRPVPSAPVIFQGMEVPPEEFTF